tara:strand:+ start:752 stop:901 length:150 start_codon:yes stop_codon:yes gene_type:complete
MEYDISDELQGVLRFIGDAIDNEFPMNMDDLNELWEWINNILGHYNETA